MNEKELKSFIINSNKIEGVLDDDELLNSLRAWKYLSAQKEITLENILYTHYDIMCDLYPQIAGRMRDCRVWVGRRECPPPEEVFDRITQWITLWHGMDKSNKPKLAHIAFEYIHPFSDGNGRVGRLLWLWHREQLGLPFKEIKFTERDEYYKWFKEG